MSESLGLWNQNIYHGHRSVKNGDPVGHSGMTLPPRILTPIFNYAAVGGRGKCPSHLVNTYLLNHDHVPRAAPSSLDRAARTMVRAHLRIYSLTWDISYE